MADFDPAGFKYDEAKKYLVEDKKLSEQDADREIARYLGSKTGFKADEALAAGADPRRVVDYIRRGGEAPEDRNAFTDLGLSLVRGTMANQREGLGASLSGHSTLLGRTVGDDPEAAAWQDEGLDPLGQMLMMDEEGVKEATDRATPKPEDYVEDETSFSTEPESNLQQEQNKPINPWFAEHLKEPMKIAGEGLMEDAKDWSFRHPELERSKSVQKIKGFKDALKSGHFLDWTASGVGENMPQMAVSMALARVPVVGMALGTAYNYALESGDAYKTLKDMGATDEEASEHMAPVGFNNAWVEMVPVANMFKGARPITKAIEKYATKTLEKVGAKLMLDNPIYAQAMNKLMGMVTKGASSQEVEQFFEEGFGEVIQQFVQNLATQSYDPRFKLTSGVGESFWIGGITGTFSATANRMYEHIKYTAEEREKKAADREKYEEQKKTAKPPEWTPGQGMTEGQKNNYELFGYELGKEGDTTVNGKRYILRDLGDEKYDVVVQDGQKQYSLLGDAEGLSRDEAINTASEHAFSNEFKDQFKSQILEGELVGENGTYYRIENMYDGTYRVSVAKGGKRHTEENNYTKTQAATRAAELAFADTEARHKAAEKTKVWKDKDIEPSKSHLTLTPEQTSVEKDYQYIDPKAFSSDLEAKGEAKTNKTIYRLVGSDEKGYVVEVFEEGQEPGDKTEIIETGEGKYQVVGTTNRLFDEPMPKDLAIELATKNAEENSPKAPENVLGVTDKGVIAPIVSTAAPKITPKESPSETPPSESTQEEPPTPTEGLTPDEDADMGPVVTSEEDIDEAFPDDKLDKIIEGGKDTSEQTTEEKSKEGPKKEDETQGEEPSAEVTPHPEKATEAFDRIAKGFKHASVKFDNRNYKNLADNQTRVRVGKDGDVAITRAKSSFGDLTPEYTAELNEFLAPYGKTIDDIKPGSTESLGNLNEPIGATVKDSLSVDETPTKPTPKTETPTPAEKVISEFENDGFTVKRKTLKNETHLSKDLGNGKTSWVVIDGNGEIVSESVVEGEPREEVTNNSKLSDEEIFDLLYSKLEDTSLVDKALKKGMTKGEIIRSFLMKDELDSDPKIRRLAEKNRLRDKIDSEKDPVKKLAMLINPENYNAELADWNRDEIISGPKTTFAKIEKGEQLLARDKEALRRLNNGDEEVSQLIEDLISGKEKPTEVVSGPKPTKTETPTSSGEKPPLKAEDITADDIDDLFADALGKPKSTPPAVETPGTGGKTQAPKVTSDAAGDKTPPTKTAPRTDQEEALDWLKGNGATDEDINAVQNINFSMAATPVTETPIEIDKYKNGVPYFLKWYHDAVRNDASAADYIKNIITAFGERSQPYVKKFFSEFRSGKVFNEFTPGEKIHLSSEMLVDMFNREGGWSFRDITEARKAVKEYFGLADTKDQFNKAVDEALEVAIGQISRRIVSTGQNAGGLSNSQIFGELVSLLDQQPALSSRTGTSISNQAYSTPSPIAFLASSLAGITGRTNQIVMEPTAGTGMLLMNTNPDNAIVNELDPIRAELLRLQGYDAFGNNALNFTPLTSPDVVITNPPFGTIKNQDGTLQLFNEGGFKTNQIDQAIALRALSQMKETGRAVLIVGGLNKMIKNRERGYNAKSKKAFYDHLYGNYNVTDHFTLTGDMWNKQGAGWPVDIIVIEGKGQSQKATPDFVAPTIYNSFDELMRGIEDHERTKKNFGVDASRSQQERAGSRADAIAGTKPRGTVSPPNNTGDGSGVSTGGVSGTTDSGSPTGGRVGTGGSTGISQEPAGGAGTTGTRTGDRKGRKDGVRTGDRVPATGELDTSKRDKRGVSDQGRSGSEGTTGTENIGELAGRAGHGSTGSVEASTGQTAYEPVSNSGSLKVLTPLNMYLAQKKALSGIAEEYNGDIDTWLKDELGYDSIDDFYDAFAAEQVDALAMAVHNAKNSGGFILGDQCVAGDTLILDPSTGKESTIKELYLKGKAISVLAMTRDGLVNAKASAPFRKGVAPLYEIILSDGKTIKVTSGHRFLTQDGWLSIDDGLLSGHFLASFDDLQECNLESCRSIRGEGDQRCSEITQGSRESCSGDLRQYDEPLHAVKDSAQVFPPSPIDASTHNRLSSYEDGQGSLYRDTLSRCVFRHSRSNSFQEETHAPSETLTRAFSSDEPNMGGLRQALGLSAKGSILSLREDLLIRQHQSVLCEACLPLQQYASELHQQESSSSRDKKKSHISSQAILSLPPSGSQSISFPLEDYTGMTRIVSITFCGIEEFFDMVVYRYGNYIANGIVNHNTGIGKGRVVAGVIRWALNQGITPVFVTEKQQLYADMYRDLTDIGLSPEIIDEILQTNANPIDLDADNKIMIEGTKLKGYKGIRAILGSTTGGKMPTIQGKQHKIVFTTYSQFNTQYDPGSSDEAANRRFMRQLFEGGKAMLIMDEAHNAGGQKGMERPVLNRRTGNIKRPYSMFFRDMINMSNGVVYSSATYAKNPAVMSLYSATDLRLGVPSGNIMELAGIITSGGIPLQQITAAMLTEAGQYIRRERSFEGVTYTPELHDVDVVASNKISEVLSAIRLFEDEHIVDNFSDFVGSDPSIGEGAEKGQGFTSIMHNIINQAVFAMKAKAAADRAIEIVNQQVEKGTPGNQVVISFHNTMEGLIDEYRRDLNLEEGDQLNLTFNDVLNRYLLRTRQYKIKDDAGNVISVGYISDEALTPEARALFKEIEAKINGLDLSSVPASPVDYMQQRMREAGIEFGEITGRKWTLDYSGEVPRLSKRDSKLLTTNGKNKTIGAFNNGKVKVVFLNSSGSTGISLHASEKNPLAGQGQRTMIIAQPAPDINTHMQTLGRVHRTGQVRTPNYIQLVANLPAEKKFSAMLAAKMKSLNANTTANAEGHLSEGGVVDFYNKYGDRIAADMLAQAPLLNEELGSPYKADSEGVQEDLLKKVTGRLPLLSSTRQEEIYKALAEAYTDMIAELDATGTNDLEAKAYDLQAVTKRKVEIVPARGSSPFQGAVYAEQVTVNRIGKPMNPREIKQALEENKGNDDKAYHKIAEAWAAYKERVLSSFRTRYDAATTDVARQSIETERRKTEQSLDNQERMFNQMARVCKIGNHVTLDMGNIGAVRGVVIDVSRKGKTVNPIAMSDFRIKIAVANEIRTVNFPMSKFSTNAGDTRQTAIQIRSIPAVDTEFKSFAREGERDRETRWIITGNLFTGFGMSKQGQIVTYTKADGGSFPGVLLPRGADPVQAAGEQPVTFQTGAQVSEFMTAQEAQATGRKVANGDLAFMLQPSGDIYLQTPSTKAKGEVYWRNSQLKAIVGEFEKPTQNSKVMRTKALSAEEIEKAAQLFIDNDMYWSTETEIPLARQIAGLGQPKDVPVTEEILDKIKETGDLKKTLGLISTTAENEDFAAIAKHIAGNLADGQIKAKVIERDDDTPADVRSALEDAGGAIVTEADGTKTVYIFGPSYPDKYSGSETTLIHEGIHAVTDDKIEQGLQEGTSTALGRAVNDLAKLQHTVSEHIKDMDLQLGRQVELALTDLSEFATYGLTNRQFQEAMRGLKVEKKTAWTKFVESIRKILGMPKDFHSALDELLRIYEEIANIDSNGNVQMSSDPMVSKETRSIKLQETDKKYLDLAKDPKKNEAELQKMVDDAAKAAGYSVGPVYHGTNEQFTKFSADKSNFGMMYFAPDKETAIERGRPGRGVEAERVVKVFLKPTEVDLKDWWSSGDLSQYKGSADIVLGVDIPVDAFSDQAEADKFWNLNDEALVKEAQKQGWVREFGVKNPDQIKSADPVTYDDNGNVIPLSERFNPQSDDIRYSLGETGRKMTAKEMKDVTSFINKVLGDRVKVIPVDTIEVDLTDPDVRQHLLESGYTEKEIDGLKADAAGKFTNVVTAGQVKALIQLASRADTETAMHEATHGLFRMALTPAEQKFLLDKYGSEEDLAKAWGKKVDTLRKRKPFGKIETLFNKMLNLWDSLKNFTKGKGFKSEQGMLQKFVSGKYAKKVSTKKTTQSPAFAKLDAQKVAAKIKKPADISKNKTQIDEAYNAALERGDVGDAATIATAVAKAHGIEGAISPVAHNQEGFMIPVTQRFGDNALGRSLDPEIEKKFEEQRGVEKKEDKTSSRWTEIKNEMTRHYKHLDPKIYGKTLDSLRLLEGAAQYSKQEAARKIAWIVKGLTEGEKEVFRKIIILYDITKDVDSGLYSPDSIPIYDNYDQLQKDLEHFNSQRNAAISNALKKRMDYMQEIKEDLVRYDLIPAKVLHDKRYFHRQILRYYRLREATGVGTSSPDAKLRKKGFERGRTGSLDAYNTEYAESEFEFLSHSLSQIAAHETLRRIDKDWNIVTELRGQARDHNHDMYYDRKGYDRNDPDRDKTKDPLYAYNKRIAMGFSGLKKLAKAGELPPVPNGLVGAMRALSSGQQMFFDEQVGVATIYHPDTFRLLSYLANKGEVGSIEAATILKAVQGKRREILNELGDQAIDFRAVMRMTKPNYVVWKPKAGTAFYWTNSISDKIIEQAVKDHKGLNLEDVTKALARGKDVEWVIPAELAKTLDNFGPKKQDNALLSLIEEGQNKWKQWVLINPLRVAKYNINNATGDLDIAWAYDKKILTYLKGAYNDLRMYYKDVDKLPDGIEQQINDAMRLQVMGSGLSFADIPAITKHLERDQAVEAYQGGKLNIMAKGWGKLKGATEFRENLLRLAAYRYFLDRVDQHKAGTRPIDSAASDPSIIADMKNGDKKELAARLARDLLGDYGNLSVTSNFLRRMVIPFWSFQAVNATRYYRLFTNTMYDEALTPQGRVDARKRLKGLATRRGISAMIRQSIRAAVLGMMINLANVMIHPDEEKKFSDSQRGQLHLILWTDSEGFTHTLRVQGAFSELMGWLALENFTNDVHDLATGKTKFSDKFTESRRAPLNKLVQGISPYYKTMYENIFSQTTYPDVYNPRPIRDKVGQFLRTFSADKIWNIVSGKPILHGSIWDQVMKDIGGLVAYSTDPGTAAYYQVRNLVRKYKLEELGIDASKVIPSDRSNALYYYKQSLRLGDAIAAAKYLNMYKEMGGTKTGLAKSVKAAHPLTGLTNKTRRGFMKWLSDDQKEKLRTAEDWYTDTYKRNELRRKVRW